MFSWSIAKISAEAKRIAAVGERSFNDQLAAASRSTMYQNGISVSIVEEGATSEVEPKKLVPWLHGSQRDEQTASPLAASPEHPADLNEPQEPTKNDIDSLRLFALKFETKPPETLTAEENAEEPVAEPVSMESDDDEVIYVAGKR
ncbi:unnamed protein product, partial [Gongylonema pulchrum]|uniref:DUF3835 domain-containing protein n=1 Tax=Gongylonema pulchrum TaxID=637853 RepID=A0A183D5E6_9BILA